MFIATTTNKEFVRGWVKGYAPMIFFKKMVQLSAF